MRLFRLLPGWLACLLVLAGAAIGRAAALPDPLRLIPDQADFFFKVEQPRKLADIVYGLKVLKQLQKIDAVREYYDSTNSRRFQQLVAYLEKQLGLKWPELLEQLAGGGAAVGFKIGGNPAPGVLVVQGKNEKLLQKFFKLALSILDQELARQEAKERPVKGTYRKLETVHLGEQLHAALAGSALLVSNNARALELALDLHLDGGQKNLARRTGVDEARKLLDPHPLAWGWLNMGPIHKLPQAKDLLAATQNDPLLTVTFGPFLDLARRSPFVCAGVYHKENRFTVSVRVPRGREGMPAKWAAFLPPEGKASTLPLLTPKNVIYSTSSYYDASQFWKQRKLLFNDKQRKTFEDFDKNSGRFLVGTRFSTLLETAGPHLRFVVVQQTKVGYKTQPKQFYPAGAFVIDMRKPDEFGKTMDTILRAAALFGGGQFRLKLVEQKQGKHTIIGYRFPEGNAKLPRALRNDVNNIRYNFSPCFVRAGKYFIASSTMELAAELLDLLDQESKQTREKAREGGSLMTVSKLYGSGGASILNVFKDHLLTQAILGLALSSEEAERQVNLFIDLVGKLGVVEHSQRYTRTSFHYDTQWQVGK
jgi:hypothetical protein